MQNFKVKPLHARTVLIAVETRWCIHFASVQVSAGALAQLLTATGSGDAAIAMPLSPNTAASSVPEATAAVAAPPLTIEAVRHVRQVALQSVAVPPQVVDLLVDLRTYMQEVLEPPAYVSDRRMVKAVELMQVC
jgi:MoxR-like ATPase